MCIYYLYDYIIVYIYIYIYMYMYTIYIYIYIYMYIHIHMYMHIYQRTLTFDVELFPYRLPGKFAACRLPQAKALTVSRSRLAPTAVPGAVTMDHA